MRPPAPRPLITAALLVAAAALLAISPYALLVMLPALTLAWVVLIGWFTGERAIAFARRIVTRLRRARPRLPRAGTAARPQRVLRRGGLLLADSLASRPPPHFATR